MTDDDPIADRLRALVWADPVPDGPREVYADYLQQQGDPLGELIALQLERARTSRPITRRELALREPHGRRAARPLEFHLNRFAIERGFIATGTPRSTMPPEIAMHPAWSTLERMEIVWMPHPILANPHLQPRLVLCATDEIVIALSLQLLVLPFATLSGKLPHVGLAPTEDLLAAFDHRRVFERVRAISFSAYHLERSLSSHQVLESRLMAQLAHLHLTFTSTRFDDLRMWKRWFLTTTLARLSFDVPLEQRESGGSVRDPARFLYLEIDREGDALRLQFDEPTKEIHVAAVLAAADAVGGDRTRVVVEDVDQPRKVGRRHHAVIQALRQPFAMVSVTTTGVRSRAP